MLSLRQVLTGVLITSIAGTSAQSTTSTLFEHATVIAFNQETESNEILHDTSILVQNDTVAAIFSSSDNISGPEIPADAEIIQAKDTIISPGFIDTHRHAWQTAYRTLGSNTTLAEYYVRFGPSSKAARLFNADDVYLSTLMGLYEALDSGVTSLLDHAHGIRSTEIAEAGLRAYIDSGARVWFGYSLDPWNGFSLQDRANHWLNLTNDGPARSSDLVEMGVSFDSWRAAEESDLQTALNLMKSNNISVLTTHWAGGPWGAASTPSLLDSHHLLNRSFPIVFSHASYITPPEYQLLKRFDQYVSITPESEMHYGHTNSDSDFIMDQASLGIDTHFTYSGDILTQARTWLQSVRHRAFRKVLDSWKIPRHNPMSVNQAFHLATRAGALALRRGDLGVIRVGAKADLVVFDGRSTSMLGWRDPIAAVILHAHASNVQHVMVGGRLVKRDGKLLAESLNETAERFLQSARRIQDEAVELDFDVEEAPPASNGLPLEGPELVDAVRGIGTGY